MAFFKTFIITFTFLCTSIFSVTHKNHILYLMNAGQYEKAISNYQKIYAETNVLDFEILQQMAILILQSGAKSSDPTERQLAMFGAGLATSTHSLNILEKGLLSPEMGTQLTALHFICNLQDDEINNILVKAMSSDFLETRIEAALQMAIRKHPCAFGQIQSLMQRLPPFIKPFFPQFFGLIGSSDATGMLKNLLYDSDPNVRVQSILAIAQNNRDDLLYLLRKKIKHASIAEQEALAMSLAYLNDSSCIDEIKKYSVSSTENVRLAALLALYQLGDKSQDLEIIKYALEGNLFAISALSKIENSEKALIALTKSQNTQTKLNASIALLYRKDPSAIDTLKELLISKNQNIEISPYVSLGKTLTYYQIIYHGKKRKNIDLGLSLELKQRFLKQALELKENNFLSLADEILKNNQNDLVPYLCQLLANLNSENAISLLKKYATQAGAPLIRNYCNLTLYKMNIEGDYLKHIKDWLKRNSQNSIIELKPFTPNKITYEKNQYNLSPDETTYLLIEIFSTLAEKHNIEGIMILLENLKTTHKLNRCPLAGILLKASE